MISQCHRAILQNHTNILPSIANMPTHRGIKVSVISQLELKVHPEFPHPESSQFTYRSPDSRKGAAAFTDWTPPSASSDSKADRLLGRQSVVSVYIPSMPGISCHSLCLCGC